MHIIIIDRKIKDKFDGGRKKERERERDLVGRNFTDGIAKPINIIKGRVKFDRDRYDIN